MQIEKFTRENLPAIRREIDAALAEVSRKFGVKLATKNIRFSEFQFTVPVEATIEGKAKDYSGLGYPALGASFVVGGKGYIIKGHEPRRPKYPITAEGPDGKSYKFSLERVRAALAVAGVTGG